MGVPTLLISGPGGVGKTTTAFEICRRLEAAGMAYAMIDTDELDRVYPPPVGDPDKRKITGRNLAAVWSNLEKVGARRLVLTMVAASVEAEIPWVLRAVPEAKVTVVRLIASEEELLQRLCARESGPGYEDQAARTLEQARLMVREDEDERIVVRTTGNPVAAVAIEVLRRTGWA